MSSIESTVRRTAALCTLSWLFAIAAAGDPPPLAEYFGFGEMQIYKLKPDVGQLRLADLNQDGKLDIVVWNSQQSRIDIFYQADAAAPAVSPPTERNDIASRGPLRNENVSVAYRVAALDVGDLTGDGRPDIVFFGEPKEVVILPGKTAGGFAGPLRMRAAEGEPRGGCLALGDFNGDKRTDVALLGREAVLIFPQKPDGGLAKPMRLLHNIASPMLMLAADFNHDGRTDLIIGSDDDRYGAYVFLQDPDGGLGPMQRVRVPKLRSMTIAPSDKGDSLLAIESTTGRLKEFAWEAPEAADNAEWPMWLYSYPIRSKNKQQPLVVGDVTGDGVADVVAVDPDAAQLFLLRGGPHGLEPPIAFPALVGTVDLCAADVDGDGRDEILSVSPKEKMIGVSRFADSRLTFPTAMPIQDSEPLVVAVGSPAADSKGAPTHMAYLSKGEKGVELHVAPLKSGGGGETIAAVGELKDDAAGLRFVDVNQDGRNDLLLFVRFNPLQTFLQTKDGAFERLSGSHAREGLVKDVRIEAFCVADVNGDGKTEVVVAQNNLARALAVSGDPPAWTIVDQFNTESAESELAGLAALSASGGSPMFVAYDRKSRDLITLERQTDKTYAVTRTLSPGTFELTTLLPLMIGPKGGESAVILGDPRSLALLRPASRAATLIEKRSYESPIKDAWPGDTVVGDLNHDGVSDVALLDFRKANVEILTTLTHAGGQRQWTRAMAFQVFQGKRFSDEPDRGGDPREGQIGDVTGDGVNDLILLAHDRVLVYPGQ
ncbi:MAG: VCBS repeat-containing protein [Phycisphaerae bacterium]